MLTHLLSRRALLAGLLALVTMAALPGSGRSALAPEEARAIDPMFVSPYTVSHVMNYVPPQPPAQQGAIAGQASLFKLYGSGFPAQAANVGDIVIQPPPVQIEIEWPDYTRYTVGANIKSSTELHFELPAHLAVRTYVRLYVVTPATEYWYPSAGTGYAQLSVKRSSSDVDCDLSVDATDAYRVLEVLSGLDHESSNCSLDADKSGELDLADAIHVRLEVAGLIQHPLFSFTP